MRQIVLDTETTGIGHDQGHRVIEIGCVELIDRKLTGKHYHVYVNPERPVDDGAFRVHGISDAFLKDKPLFTDIVDEFIHFIDGAELVIHNAPFDVGFLNSEFKHVKWGRTLDHHCEVLDTLVYAREKHPGQRNSLDALCKRYYIDNSNRELHGALLDAEILAFVYLAMTGGQGSLFTTVQDSAQTANQSEPAWSSETVVDGLVIQPTQEEKSRHLEFVQLLTKKSGCDYWDEE